MKDHIKSWRMLYLFIAVVVSVVVGFIYHAVGSFWPSGLGDAPYCDPFCVGDESEIRANLGALGDVVGGLVNPILTFCSIVLLIHTIRLTQKTNQTAEETLQEAQHQNRLTKDALDASLEQAAKQNELTEKSLEATREQIDHSIQEMKDNREELKVAAKAQQEIAKTQESQRRSHAFFEHYKAYSDFTTQMKTYGSFGQNVWPLNGFYGRLILFDGELSREAVRSMFDYEWYYREWIDKLFVQVLLSELNDRLMQVIASTLTNQLKIYLSLYIYAYDENDEMCEESGGLMLKALLHGGYLSMGSFDYKINGDMDSLMSAAVSRAVASITE